MTKICNKCKKELSLEMFTIRKENGRHRDECKECQALYNKQYRLKNEAKLKEKVKADYHANAEERKANAKDFYKENKDKIKARTNAYYYKTKPDRQQARQEYQKKRLATDIVYRVSRNLKNRLWYALNNKMWKKDCSFAKYIGLSDYNALKIFLESHFTKEMTWDNYGKYWDIDHIIPLSSAKNEDDLYKLCHYTNLLPRESKENRNIKRDNFDFNSELIVTLLDYNQGKEFIKAHHYLKTDYPAQYSFGAFLKNGTLVGVCTFHTPFSPGLKNMICGPEYSNEVIELNRLAMVDTLPKNAESWFVSKCINSGEIEKHIIVSFADTEQNHKGTIYQALNFIYTGLTDKHKDFSITGLDKHASTLALKHTAEELKEQYGDKFVYKSRTQKHRYIYFLGDKRIKKELESNLKLEKQIYPK